MSTEQGIVERVEPGWVWVKAKRLGACAGCGSYDHAHTIGNKMVIRAANLTQAQKGDVVVIHLSTKAKFKCIATVYLLPVLGLFVGAFAATFFSPQIELDPSLGVTLGALAGLAGAILLMRFIANRMVQQKGFTPVVKRVVRPAERFHWN